MLVDRAGAVVGAAKSPTTHHDLSVGITGAIDAVLASTPDASPTGVELVALSTTLATNALVEGLGRRVAAVVIGFDDGVVERTGLAAALGGDPAILVAGGHDPHGSELARLDEEALVRALATLPPDVEGVAVVSQFSVRNPAHELRAAELVRRTTGRPVTPSHLLSSRLDGPRRAVTAVLNARLVPIIDELVDTTERALEARSVRAPLMVVRGDGSLVSAAFVRERPIETILSGPAASLVGAAHLTGLRDAVVADVGGTTTDVAVLRDGVPAVSADGAVVGGHRTMVRAVAMHTFGLGGDSEVHHDDRAAGARLTVGPRRAVPVGVLAMRSPDVVHDALARQVRRDGVEPAARAGLDATFLVRARDTGPAGTPHDDVEAALLEAVGPVRAAADVLTTTALRRAATRLVRRGALQWGRFTPTDASHVLGSQATFDADAARGAATLLARRRDRTGRAIAPDGPSVASATVDTLVRSVAEAVLASALHADGLPPEAVGADVVTAAIDRLATRTPPEARPTTRLHAGLALPLVGLGAAAATYVPRVGALLGTQVVVPEHAGVANAVGAVAGRVRAEVSCTVSSPEPGHYVVHTPEGPVHHGDRDAALATATATARAGVEAAMAAAGGSAHLPTETELRWEESTVEVSGLPLFVEGTLTAVGWSRPALEGPRGAEYGRRLEQA